MTRTAPARRRTTRRLRIRWVRVVGLLAALVAIAAALLDQPPAPPTLPTIPLPTAAISVTAPAPERVEAVQGAVDGLDPALMKALDDAATAAADDAVVLTIQSGRRTPEHQAELLRDAVAKYGSEAEAARWVARPNTSAHVSGDAVDMADAGAAWLSSHGAEYGLCQIYRNEPWHYELRPDAVDFGCPAMYEDPTHDPRMYR